MIYNVTLLSLYTVKYYYYVDGISSESEDRWWAINKLNYLINEASKVYAIYRKRDQKEK